MVTLALAAAIAAPLFSQEAGAGRLLWRRTNPDAAIYLPSGYKDGTNQQVVGVVTPRKTFVVVWTIGSREGMTDHRLVVSRSTDLGKTWSPPLVLDSEGFDGESRGDGRRAQYGFPFVVPSTGRVYVFYNKNTGQNQVRADITGVLKYQYSDDDGVTWKPGGLLPIARGEFSHPDPKADPNFIGIYAPIMTSKGTVIAGVARYKAGPDLYKGIPYQEWETELIFFRFDNILTERDPAKLAMTTLPRGSRGLRVPRLDDPAKVWSNEPSLVELSDGRLLAAIRTRNNAVYYAVSADQGETWSRPEPLRFTNGGNPVPNPSAPCPIVRLRDGRIVLMFYNQPIDQGPFGRRDPVYLSVGRETLTKPQPVEFGAPREFMNIGGQMVPGGTAWPQIASYSSFLEFEDKLYLFYNDCKYFVLFKEAPPHLLGERPRPQVSAPADWRNIANGYVIPDEGYSDQPYVVVTNDGNWLCVLTTGKGVEGQAGQHIAATISSDKGRTWSPLIDIEPATGPEASWAMPLKVPYGRVYVFYTYNKENIREVPGIASEGLRRRVDTLGGYMFKYSDDHGRTWSKERHEIPMRLMRIDRESNFAGKTLLFWGVGKPIMHGTHMYFGFSKVGKQGLPGTFVRSRGCIMRSDNILRERDPKKIRWELLPEGDEGLRAPKGPIAEETNVAALSDGALYAVYRTIDGYLCHAYSRDRGRTWTEPEYATYTPGGRRIKNPRAFGLVRRFSNGKYLLWYHNHGGEAVHLKSWDYYRERNPGWVAGGIEKDGRIHWSEPEILLYDDDPATRISYPDLIEDGGRFYITETQKSVARVHEIDRTLLEGLWGQWDKLQLVVPERPGSGAAVPLPPLDLREGFAIDFWLRLRDLSPAQTILDARDAGGRGIHIGTSDRFTVQLEMSDGSRRASWDSDPGTHAGTLRVGQWQHVAIIVDGGPRLILFVVDGVLNDGGPARQYGWGRFPADLGDVNGVRVAKIAPLLHGDLKALRVFDRPLRVSEAVGNYRKQVDNIGSL